jgi:hypothetical protein
MPKEPTELEIDEFVESEADDDSAWGQPVDVTVTNTDSELSIPADLVARAAFLAGVHREESSARWLTRIIRERIEIEESAFAEAKREMASHT